MEFGSIEREIRIEASREVVFAVISSPEHLREWWPDDAKDVEPRVGATGTLIWAGEDRAHPREVPLTVVEAEYPSRFAFRWAYEDAAEHALLVTFELEERGAGTLLRMTETGFREQGWELAALEAAYQDHVDGWAYFLPRLGAYAAKVAG